jgi:copper chaperone CopZ
LWAREGGKDLMSKEENMTSDSHSTSGSQRIELTITGMTCDHCVASVKRALAASNGVESAEVTLKPPRAVVSGEHLDPRQLIAAVTELGYSATLVRGV